MKKLIALVTFVCAFSARAATVNNDDSCDIAVLPAATLLLPYFEVDLDHYDSGAETTIFSITNVTNVDRIAHVTLWTDYAYPVIGFDVYLTGYDVQAIDLWDVLGRGIIAPDAGTGTAISQRQRYSDANRSLDLSNCGRLPGELGYAMVELMWEAFHYGDGYDCYSVGGRYHSHAVGYATIDVVGACGSAGVTDETYWTKDLRYDNVLTGEYTQINRQHERAQAEPLVHIRAIPEGGTPMRRRIAPEDYDAGFAHTFYGRFQPADAPRLDGRQPLPSQFAARWIEGDDGAFETSLKVWREGGRLDCASVARIADLTVNDVVLFDENENVIGSAIASKLPATSMTSIADASVFPPIPNGTTSGWAYVDLDDRPSPLVRPRQGWVISSMRAVGLYATDTTAVAMGNGCSPHARDAAIGPAPNASERHGIAATDNDDSCDIGLYPAATLLLPYFDVDLGGLSESTLVSITNVSNRDRIARVTLWTEYAFPVLSFNVPLGGYDVQSIDLYDVIGLGRLPHAAGGCASQVQQLSPAVLMRMQLAFMEGIVPALGDASGCSNVGNPHEDAVGYATIDIVRNCSNNLPTASEYWTKDLAYDNVLTGDVQQVSRGGSYAHGSPLVHIRAVPEGGRSEAPFSHTFYSRFQPAATPKLDGRQPLPSHFAARWRVNYGWHQDLDTYLNIWREPLRTVDATCATYEDNYMDVAEIVVFDEAENAFVNDDRYRDYYTLPVTSRTSVQHRAFYPAVTNGAVAGWVYLNLDNDLRTGRRATSNWVVVTAFDDEGRYGVAFDATALGNGCSPRTPASEVSGGTYVIGPSENKR